MSVTGLNPPLNHFDDVDQFDAHAPYRSLSRPAVASLVLAVFSPLALLFPTLLLFPALGVVMGWVGLRAIKRYPEEWSGLVAGRIGLYGCLVLLVSGVALHATVYALEVPEGYQRISFYDLQPSDKHPEMPVPPEAIKLDGQRVFVKGYVYPDGQQSNIQKFVLVPDRGTCCFGGQPKLTDMIEVTIRTKDRIKYSYQMRKLAGTLHVDTRLKPVTGLGGVYYQLDADYVR